MPVKLIHQNYLEVVGEGPVLLTNILDPKQSEELYAGRIVEEAALLSKTHAIIPKEVKNTWDPNALQQITSEVEARTRQLVEELQIKCVIALGGTNERGVWIRGPRTSSKEAIGTDLAKDALSTDSEMQISVDDSTDGTGSGNAITIHISLGPDARGFRKDLIVARIADLVGVIRTRLGWSETDQGSSDVLD
jgi:predicted RNase H-related nuclease YkuK (DUF458 family)